MLLLSRTRTRLVKPYHCEKPSAATELVDSPAGPPAGREFAHDVPSLKEAISSDDALILCRRRPPGSRKLRPDPARCRPRMRREHDRNFADSVQTWLYVCASGQAPECWSARADPVPCHDCSNRQLRRCRRRAEGYRADASCEPQQFGETGAGQRDGQSVQ